MSLHGLDPQFKKQLEIPKWARWLFFTLGTSALPIIIRVVIMLLTEQKPTITGMRSELFFLVIHGNLAIEHDICSNYMLYNLWSGTC